MEYMVLVVVLVTTKASRYDLQNNIKYKTIKWLAYRSRRNLQDIMVYSSSHAEGNSTHLFLKCSEKYITDNRVYRDSVLRHLLK